jgi:hypothetical protein
MHRRIALFVLTTLLAVPVAAQTTTAQATGDWLVRLDQRQNAQDPDDAPDIKFMTMGTGIHVVGGPAGVYWKPDMMAKGNYTLRGNFTLVRPSSHPNYYGLVFGGSNLDAATQNYIYFLVAQDGTYIIKHRVGDRVNDVRGETMHAAIRRPMGTGSAQNTLEVRVAGDTISYVINGQVVHTTPKSGETAMPDGLVGARINHVTEVMVDGLAVQQN